jgi:hypothetical protein
MSRPPSFKLDSLKVLSGEIVGFMLDPKNRKSIAVGFAVFMLLFIMIIRIGCHEEEEQGASVANNSSVPSIPYPGEDKPLTSEQRSLSRIPQLIQQPTILVGMEKIVEWIPSIQATARESAIPPYVLGGVVLLESGGKQFAYSTADCAGPGQFSVATGKQYGLEIDIAESRRLRRKMRSLPSDSPVRFLVKAKLMKVDERFDPQKAIPATGRYLVWLRNRYGGDLETAIAGYHMGPGNLDGVWSLFLRGSKKHAWCGSIGGSIQQDQLTWTTLLDEVSPGSHPKTFEKLKSLQDDSPSYRDRVGAAALLLQAYVEDRPKYNAYIERFSHQHTGRLWGIALEREWYEAQAPYQTWEDMRTAVDAGTLVPVTLEKYGVIRDGGIGAKASAEVRPLFQTTTPPFVGLLAFIGSRYHQEGGGSALKLNSLTRSAAYQERVGHSPFSAHERGVAADIAVPHDIKDKQALEYVLCTLRMRGDIGFILESPTSIPHYHLCLSPEAKQRFEGVYNSFCK